MYHLGRRRSIHRCCLCRFWQRTMYASPLAFHYHSSTLFVFTVETSVIPGITGCYQTVGSAELFIPFLLLFAVELGMLEATNSIRMHKRALNCAP